MNLKTSQKGFTIVELLIVIVVIAILAAISIVAFTGIQQRGRDSAKASDVSNIVKALTAYTTDDTANGGSGGTWPATASAAATAISGYSAAGVSSTITDKLTLTAHPAAGATGTAATNYSYLPCGTSPNYTGATIGYYKENGNTGVTVTAGKC